MKFTLLSRLAVKAIEVAGAGAVSALCAYLLGQFERHPAPAPAPVPAVIQISPATADNRAGAELGRVASLQRPEADSEPRVASAPAKAAKPPSSATTLRNQKSEQGARSEPKARNGEPLAIKPVAVAANSASKGTGQTVQPPTDGDQAGAWNGGGEERPLFARLTSWFLPENERIFGDLPRPPVPVGDSLRSAM